MANSTRTRKSRFLFDFSPLRDGLNYQGVPQALTPSGMVLATYDRGGTVGAATSVDANGRVFTPGYKTPRWYHRYDAASGLWTPRGILLEGERTNAIIYSQALEDASWTANALTSRLLNASGIGGIAATANTLIASGADAYVEKTTATSTAAGTKATLSVFAKYSNCAFVYLFDEGDAVSHRAWFNVQTGVVGTIQGGGTSGVEVIGGGYYRLWFTYPVTNSYNQRCRIGLARSDTAADSAATDAIIATGPQGEPTSAFPSSYMPTGASTVTRSADALSFAFNAAPQVMTVYADIVALVAADATTNYHTAAIQNAAAGNPSFKVIVEGSALQATNATHHNGTASVSSNAGTVAWSQRVEQRAVLGATGTVLAGASIESGAETTGSTSAANTLSAAWAATARITIGAAGDGTQPLFGAVRRVRIPAGVQTLAYMRQG